MQWLSLSEPVELCSLRKVLLYSVQRKAQDRMPESEGERARGIPYGRPLGIYRTFVKPAVVARLDETRSFALPHLDIFSCDRALPLPWRQDRRLCASLASFDSFDDFKCAALPLRALILKFLPSLPTTLISRPHTSQTYFPPNDPRAGSPSPENSSQSNALTSHLNNTSAMPLRTNSHTTNLPLLTSSPNKSATSSA